MSDSASGRTLGQLLDGLRTGKVRVLAGETADDHLGRQTLRHSDGTATGLDMPRLLNALMDEEIQPRLLLWRFQRETDGPSWIADDPGGIATVALALMTPPRQASQLRWFLDVTSWRFEERRSGDTIRSGWLPIQALCGTGLRTRWAEARFDGMPPSTLDRIDHVAAELLSRPLELTGVADVSRLAALLHPPKERRTPLPPVDWRLDPQIESWCETLILVTRFAQEPATAPWPAPVEPPPESTADLDARLTGIWAEIPGGSNPLDAYTGATARPGYPPVAAAELSVCALAARGRIDIDVLRADVGDPRRLSAAYERTAELIGEAVDFLREDCRMPHHDLRLLGPRDMFPALVRYIALHGRPSGAAATRLCQWYWRWALSPVGRISLGDLLAVMDDDPDATAERLMAGTPAEPPSIWTSEDLATLAGPGFLLRLLLAGPRDLATGRDITATATDAEHLPLRDILPSPWGGRLEGQIIQEGPRREPVLEALLAAPEEVAASHLLDAEALGLLRSGMCREFLAHRLRLIHRHAREPVLRLAGWPSA